MIRANGGVLGLAPEDTPNVFKDLLYRGYDSSYSTEDWDDDPLDDDGQPHELTPDEKREIVAEMVARAPGPSGEAGAP